MDNYAIEDRKIISELYESVGITQKISPYSRCKPNNKNLELLVAILLPSLESLSEERLSEIEVKAEENRIKICLDNTS